MGAESKLPVAQTGKTEAKSDQAVIGKEGAVHESAIELHGKEQFSWDHVAFLGAPDVAAHRLAGGVLLLTADNANLDVRRHAPHRSARLRATLGCYLQVQALCRPAL